MKYTAFDFETCSRDLTNSAFELGVCVYENKKLCEQRSWRFFPAKDFFDPKICRVTGISRGELLGLPTFSDLWPEIRPYFNSPFIVAHNLWSFDLAVLKSHIGTSPIALPESQGICTLEAARTLLIPNGLQNGRLPSVCAHLGVSFSADQHHTAIHDAHAAGQIFRKLFLDTECGNQQLGLFADSVRHSTRQFPQMPYATIASDTSSHSYFSAAYKLDSDFSPLSALPDTVAQNNPLDRYGLFSDAPRARQCSTEIEQLAARLYASEKGAERAQLLEGWAFCITGDVVDVRDGRRGLAETLVSLGAKCDVIYQNFAKTSRATYGPTNAVIFAMGEEIEKLENGIINGKMSEAAKVLKRDQAAIKFISEGYLYSQIISCLEAGTKLSFEHFVEEAFVLEKIRPKLLGIA